MPLKMLTVMRAKIAASLGSSSPEPRTIAALPPELISRIIHFTLLSPDPLYLLIVTGALPKQKKRLAKPHLNDMVLAKQFYSLCLVSKLFCNEAMKVFFSRNYWQLEVRLYEPTLKPKPFLLTGDWRGKVLYGVLWLGVSVYQIFDRPDPEPLTAVTKIDALSVLGGKAMGMMRNVRLVMVRYGHKTVHLDVVDETLVALKRGGGLERLVVQFIAHRGKDRNYGCVRYSEYETLYAMKRMGLDEKGKRKEDLTPGVHEHWKRMEEALACMVGFGPVEDVVVCGCVTDEYSFWLERMIREVPSHEEERLFDRKVEGRKMKSLE